MSGDDSETWSTDDDGDDESQLTDAEETGSTADTDGQSDTDHDTTKQTTQLIDDQGNLFGVVNVIDALVALLTLAVVVAGVALVFGGGGGGGEPETTYATLDLGTQPDEVITALNEGDYDTSEGIPGNLTISDLYIVSAGDQSRAIARVEIEAISNDGVITYDGGPLRLGRSLTIATNRYEVSGTIRDVGNASTLNTEQTEIVIEDTIDVETADELTVGDEIRIDRRPIGTVASVTRYGTDDPTQVRVVVGLSLATLTNGDTPRYGLTPVIRGSAIRLPLDDGTRFYGQIIAVGTSDPPGEATTRTVRLRLSDVRDRIADTYRPGMTETTGGETVAEVTAVNVEPSTVVTTSETGAVKANDHPINRDVTMTATLSVRETESRIQFKGTPLRQGDRITLDFGSTTIRPTVVRIR
jgi:hypothetical protein